MQLIIFDDARCDLRPLTDLRPTFDIRSGILTTRERIEAVLGGPACGLWVPDHLVATVGEASRLPVNQIPQGGSLLLVNGRWLLPDRSLVPKPGETLVDEATGTLIAAHVDAPVAGQLLVSGTTPPGVETLFAPKVVLLSRPWEVITHLAEAFRVDAELARIIEAQILPETTTVVGTHPVEVSSTARLSPSVVLDAEHGPVVVADGASVRSHAVLCGPCFVGPGSVVIEHAHIKANTVIGPCCKVGGEVGGTIFQGFANKAHAGHLGDSWVGEWVNFGAGTINSNLLNTYSEVVMQNAPDSARERTGLTFLGCLVGDHVKFAINTRIMTGSSFGTGAMVAVSKPPPATVPPFAWLTDSGARRYRLNKFVDVARRVMERRQVHMTDAYAELLTSWHDDTA